MEIAELFGHAAPFDPTAEDQEVARLVAEHRDEALDEIIADKGNVIRDAAALTVHALRPWLDDDALRWQGVRGVHRVAVLGLLVDRHAGELADQLDEDVARAAAGNGHPDSPPLVRYVAATRADLGTSPGWGAQGEDWTRELQDLLQGWAQESRLLPAERANAFGPALEAATRGGWLDALVESACMVLGDQSRLSDDVRVGRVCRLASSTVGLARDVGKHLHGEGSPASKELVCQRFAIASHVIRLDASQIARALRALLELEVRDLLDAIDRLDPSQPRATIVRRVVSAMLELDGSAHAVVAATAGTGPSRREVMQEMRSVAKADGKITSDERALLRGMDAHLASFSELMRRIEESDAAPGGSDEPDEELDQLRQSRQTILDDLFRIALADQHVTADERELLLRAMELIPSLR